MAWERRRNGRLYFYRSRRDPITGRVRKQYFGCGQHAEQEARQDSARRAERAARQQAEQRRRQVDLALNAQVAGIGREAQALTEMALLAAGYHRPQRKPWRKRRSRRTENGIAEE
jgi:hypothetical protein